MLRPRHSGSFALFLFLFLFFFQTSGVTSSSISSAWGPRVRAGRGGYKGSAQWAWLCPEAELGYGGRTPGGRKLWAVHEQEPGIQSSEVGWELAAQPVELLCLPPAFLPPRPPGPHSCPKPWVSEGCPPTRERVSCFSHPPVTLWLKHLSLLALRKCVFPISEASPASVIHTHMHLQSCLSIAGLRVEKVILGWTAVFSIHSVMFIEHLLYAGHCWVLGIRGAETVNTSSWMCPVTKDLPPLSILPTPTSLGHFYSPALCREGTQAASAVELNPSSATCELCFLDEQVVHPF